MKMIPVNHTIDIEVCLNCPCSGFSQELPQPATICWKLTIKILKQGVKYVQS